MDASTGKTGTQETWKKALGIFGQGSRGLQATGERSESRGQTGTDTQAGKGSSQKEGKGTSGERKGRLDAWDKGKGGNIRPHGIKGKGNGPYVSHNIETFIIDISLLTSLLHTLYTSIF